MIFIIEDDYDSELSYYNRPIPSMQSLENGDRVIYFRYFFKALSPPLRISYCFAKLFIGYLSWCFDFVFSQVPIDIQKH